MSKNPTRPGRPAKYTTDKERWEAQKMHRKKAMLNKQTVALSKPLIAFLHEIQDMMEVEFSFRPNLQQALRIVLTKAGYKPPKEGGK